MYIVSWADGERQANDCIVYDIDAAYDVVKAMRRNRWKFVFITSMSAFRNEPLSEFKEEHEAYKKWLEQQ